MSHKFSVSVAACAGFAVLMIAGCSSAKQPDAAAVAAPSVNHGPAWTLTLKSNCTAYGEADQCVGKYGFSVTADGKYQVGKGPKEQVITGVVTGEELATLNAAVQLVGTQANRAEAHEEAVENESDDTVTLARQDQKIVVAHNTGADFYFTTAKLESAQSVHKAIRDLAKSYYHLPFGNDCADAAAKVEALYPALQGCNADTDCVYVNNDRNWSVVAPRSGEYIFTERCEVVSPLTVANKSTILNGAAQIIDAYNATFTACGAQFRRADCRPVQQAAVVAPVCVQNRCQSRL
jgi:hypothetical protein